jgi:hypothetical protein
MRQIKLNDKWFRLFGIPLIAFMGHIIFYNRNDSGSERFGFWGIYLLSLAETVLLWETNRMFIFYFRKRYPLVEQTKVRLIWMLVACVLVTVAVRTANIFLYDIIRFWGYAFPLEAYLQSVFTALLFLIVVGGVYEGIYYFRKWKDAAVEAEALKKEQLQSQFDSLKSQLSPHFLFNSLGSLSSLIEEDPKRAQEFVNEMSSVYRYLLQANDKPLTTLQHEIRFIDAYSNMLKTRFPEGLQLTIKVDEAYTDFLLPPFTLQMLLENAVKHNAILPSRPLQVDISTNTAGQLVVENNLQPKTSPVISNKKGLHNIVTKYRLLNQPEVEIQQTQTKFRVVVPLIKNKAYADTYR